MSEIAKDSSAVFELSKKRFARSAGMMLRLYQLKITLSLITYTVGDSRNLGYDRKLDVSTTVCRSSRHLSPNQVPPKNLNKSEPLSDRDNLFLIFYHVFLRIFSVSDYPDYCLNFIIRPLMSVGVFVYV